MWPSSDPRAGYIQAENPTWKFFHASTHAFCSKDLNLRYPLHYKNTCSNSSTHEPVNSGKSLPYPGPKPKFSTDDGPIDSISATLCPFLLFPLKWSDTQRDLRKIILIQNVASGQGSVRRLLYSGFFSQPENQWRSIWIEASLAQITTYLITSLLYNKPGNTE